MYVSHPDAGFEEPYIDRESFDRYSGVEYTHDFWLVKDGAAYCIMLNDYEAVYNSFTQNGWQVSYVTSEHANTQDAMWQELFGEPEFKPMYVTTEKAVESLRD